MKSISLPFRVDGYGRVATTSDLSKIWQDRVRSVVATSLGERLMRPSFGCPTPVHLFRNTDSIETVLDVDVATAFNKWLPGITYEGMEFYSTPDTGDIEVEIRYSVPARAESLDSVSVVIEVD